MDRLDANFTAGNAYAGDAGTSSAQEAQQAQSEALAQGVAAQNRAKKAHEAEVRATALASIAPSQVDGVGSVAGASASTPQAGGITQSGPSLPDVAGDKASLAQVQMAIGNYVPAASLSAANGADAAAPAQAPSIKAVTNASPGVIDNSALDVNPNADISIAAMYTILFSVISSAQKLAGNIKRNAQQASINAKQSAVEATLDKLQADKKDAGWQLAASMVAAGASLGMAFKGGDLQNRGREALGAMMSALSRPISDMITQGYSAISINSGYQLQSREAEIAQKQDDVTAQINQSTVESSKSAWDMTTEFIRNTSQAFLTMVQNHKSTIDNIAQR